MTVFKYALLRNFKSPLTMVTSAIVPLAMIIFMRDMWTYAPQIAVGMLAMLMLMGSNLMAGVILEDRMDNSITRILTTPVSMFSYVLQNLTAAIIPLMLQILLLGILGYFRYQWTLSFTLGFTLTLSLFALANTAFVFCWNMFLKSRENNLYSYLFLVVVMAIFGGLMLPLDVLPTALQYVGAVSHPFWLMRGMTELAAYGMTLQFWLFQMILVFFAGSFLLFGGKRRSI